MLQSEILNHELYEYRFLNTFMISLLILATIRISLWMIHYTQSFLFPNESMDEIYYTINKIYNRVSCTVVVLQAICLLFLLGNKFALIPFL